MYNSSLTLDFISAPPLCWLELWLRGHGRKKMLGVGSEILLPSFAVLISSDAGSWLGEHDFLTGS